jgi:hypothetical protein
VDRPRPLTEDLVLRAGGAALAPFALATLATLATCDSATDGLVALRRGGQTSTIIGISIGRRR